MNKGPGVQWRRRFTTLALTLILPLAVVWWAFPEGLTPWRSAAIVTAWAGTALLVVNLLLMVRQPHLARLLGGLEPAYLWHHRSGMAAYLLLLSHPLTLAVDGWFEAPHRAWEILAPWAQSWPVWLGWLALVLLMFGLATTFALRLPYRRWRGFHFALGLGVVFGLAHVYVLLGEVILLLLLIVLALLALGWRLIASDLGVASLPYRVSQVTRQVPGMIEATLTPAATALAVTPGQFVLVAFGDGTHFRGCGEYHPFTVSGVAEDGTISLAIKSLGPCSQHIQAMEPGVRVRLQGPFGTFLQESAMAPQLWVAGGIGITPFIAALRAQPRTRHTTLIYLFRRAADAAFLEELTDYANNDPHFILHAVETGKMPADFPHLLQQVDELAQHEVNICGPAPMVNALLPHLGKSGVDPEMIHYERFDFR
ncbi:ferredoxin reductase family protein [Thiohalophilus sp.]|uniref:ferredoxin reductase family protein n=1 Tax=Thiohalophilus sp. TaxID=3028392 RepID=UPI002ACEF3BC|nr:ferredoxin reductase family protein [Thiohalophilus sp.]MDZ7663321.1 ferredoxin reductase family protein [Thiohalophilus sp.]